MNTRTIDVVTEKLHAVERLPVDVVDRAGISIAVESSLESG